MTAPADPPTWWTRPQLGITSYGSTAPAPGFSYLTAAMLPEPYGLGPLVFGPEPRAKNPWR